MPTRVEDPADPARCQGMAKDGQCWNRAEDGTDRCTSHNGAAALIAKAQDLRLYILTDVRSRDKLAKFQESDPVYALYEALALARMLVNKRINLEDENPDLFRDSGIINTLHLTIKRLAKTITVIETNLSLMQGKSEVYKECQLILQVVIDELVGVPDADQIIKRIAEQAVEAIYSANNNTGVSVRKLPSVPHRGYRPDEGETLIQLENVDDQFEFARMVKHERLKSLIEEIGIQLWYIEKIYNSVKGDEELVKRGLSLNEHFRTLNDLVKDAFKIEETLGNLLDASTRTATSQRLVEIVANECNHIKGFEDLFLRIGDRVEAGLIATQRRLS